MSQVLRKYFILLLLLSLSCFSNEIQAAAKEVLPLTTTKTPTDSTFHLIYEDAKTKVFYTETVCENSTVLKLKMINLSDVATVFTYKIWADGSTPKSVSLFAGQELVGICADEYKQVLLETIPTGLTIKDIKVTITY
jgi:hypothetical protein